MVTEDKKIKVLSDESERERVRRRVVLSRLKRKILKHVFWVRVGILCLVIGGMCLVGASLLGYLSGTSLGYFWGLARDFVFTPMEKIGVIDGRTNLVVLGKGGEGHTGAELTDTIMFVSVRHDDSSISIVSVPRDIWLGDLRAKLNSTYYWGNKREDEGGLKLAKSSVETIVGQPVNYGVVVNFEGFLKVIDLLGGVNVEVARGFVDEKYPIAGKEDDGCEGDPEYRCRYETIEFKAGLQMMDSETALKFVRSRNAQGDEGTDFARSARQQQVINAIVKRITEPEVFTNRVRMVGLWDAFKQNVETDMSDSAAVIVARRFFEGREGRKSYVIPEELLENPPYTAEYDYLYVFVPKKGDWSEVHEWVRGVLDTDFID